ncbi:conserved hypothetical protein [Paraburkholderia ribeironis]|uniref:Uncharacterized protein n=1 Tax=Paraburkholderia ribeironis TaxID=1247936 RepID=A0A1N7S0J9_9BURK|nr:hypothetical protein [Paraburkholderia ribeironis]SIT40497.1 conserved hypothetical protein [Paraburkholderia ribeironis]
MQIDSAMSPTLPTPDRATTSGASAANDAVAQTATSATSAQDDAVQISAEGAAAAAQDGSTTAQDGAGSDSAGESAPESGASAVQSFAYGTLGLERPDQSHEDRDAFYTAGRWLAAGMTIGGIISLLA